MGVVNGKERSKTKILGYGISNCEVHSIGVACKGNVTVYGTYDRISGKGWKFIYHTCETTFCDRTNTPFYDLRTDEEKVKLALKME